ncbi:MAG: hypothetical protein Kow0040_00300 [Thermogutta sp.]
MHIWVVVGALVAMAGHVVLWAVLWNRLHGCGLAYGICSKTTALLVILGAAIPSAFTVGVLRGDLPLWTWPGGAFPADSAGAVIAWVADTYILVCWLILPYSLAVRVFRRLKGHPHVVRYHRLRARVAVPAPVSGAAPALPARLRSLPRRDTDAVDFAGRSPEPRAQAHSRVLRLPGNESLLCEFTDVGFQLDRLPPGLDGLSLIQLSDLHFSGRIHLDFYEAVVDAANRRHPDLAVVTGDIVDHADCLEDAAAVLGRLQAKHGVYFILGNHDFRLETGRIRERLVDAGLIDLGGRVKRLAIGRNVLLIGGDERPWGPDVPDFDAAVNGDLHRPFRLLLAHTPDQFRWAARNDVDLVLAGHTHGGQVCMPWLGPILTPCASGIRYSSGAFYRPPTAMYVTRGVGGEFPIRYFCPPEVACIVLHAASASPIASVDAPYEALSDETSSLAIPATSERV